MVKHQAVNVRVTSIYGIFSWLTVCKLRKSNWHTALPGTCLLISLPNHCKQGSLFKRLRDNIMNVAPATHDLPGPRSVLGNMESSNIDGQMDVNHEINVS